MTHQERAAQVWDKLAEDGRSLHVGADPEEITRLLAEQFEQVAAEAKDELVTEGTLDHCRKLCPRMFGCGLDTLKR